MRKYFVLIYILGALSLNAQNPIVFDMSKVENNTQPGFQKLYERARKARVFFSGENHSMVEFNSRMEYTMMRSLYEHCGYRNFIIEMSPVRAYYMERYVSHNDSVARNYLQSVSSSKFLALFDHLHKWMQRIPEKDRIKIHGIDVERFYDMSLYMLSDAISLEKKTPPREIYFLTQSIIPQITNYLYNQGTSSYFYEIGDMSEVSDSRNSQKKISMLGSYEIPKLFDTIQKYKPIIEKWLSDSNKLNFLKGFNGFKEYVQWNQLEETSQQYLWREETMFRNFLTILSKDTTQKFFGQFGRCHSALSKQSGDCGWYNYKSVCNKVKNRYFGGDSTKILSLAIMYRDRDEFLNSIDFNRQTDMEYEISDLKSTKSKLPMLFDLSDSTLEYKELRKKFNFILLHSPEVPELECLDSQVIKMQIADNSTGYTSERSSFQYNVFGLSYGSPNIDLMNQFLADKGVKLTQMPKWYFNHHITYAHWSRFKMQANLFYGGNEVYGDSTKKINYRLMGANLGLGAMVLKTDKIKLDLMAIGGGLYQSLQSYPESKDILNANNNIVKIESQSFVYGGLVQLRYSFTNYIEVGLKYQLLYTPNDIRWNYENTNILYQNLGKSKGAIFQDFGIFLNFIWPYNN